MGDCWSLLTVLLLISVYDTLADDDKKCGIHVNNTDIVQSRFLNEPYNFMIPETRVIGGVETSPHTWPWTVQLLYKGRHKCGAALIDEQFVATAAHCFVRSRDPAKYTVLLGGHETLTGESHNVKDISIHFLFNLLWPSSYDIAVLRIAPKANVSDTVRTICLPLLPPLMNKMCVVAGWGITDEHGTKATTLREIHVPILSYADCNGFNQYGGRIHLPSMICAGYTQGSVDACQGDSGGPLMCHSNGAWELQGLVSWGIGCGQAGHPGVYASVQPTVPWIQFEMLRMKIEKPN